MVCFHFTQLKHQGSPELQAIILTCLQPDIHQRYPSVAKLTRDLRRFNHRKSVSVYTENTAEQIKRFIQNNTALTVDQPWASLYWPVFAAVYLQQLLLLQEQATIEKENTSHLIQIISGHARSIDRFCRNTVAHSVDYLSHTTRNTVKRHLKMCHAATLKIFHFALMCLMISTFIWPVFTNPCITPKHRTRRGTVSRLQSYRTSSMLTATATHWSRLLSVWRSPISPIKSSGPIWLLKTAH